MKDFMIVMDDGDADMGDKFYECRVVVVDKIEPVSNWGPASGRYSYIGTDGCSVNTLTLATLKPSTVAHECLHAALHYFREYTTMPIREVLADHDILGEEAFVHTFSDLYQKVLDGLAE